MLVYLRRPPPPPRLPPPPREPMLDAPRELLARAELPLVPPRALPLEPPLDPDETLRLPTRSPPPPPRSLVPALGRLPPRSPPAPRSPAPPRLSPTPPDRLHRHDYLQLLHDRLRRPDYPLPPHGFLPGRQRRLAGAAAHLLGDWPWNHLGRCRHTYW